MNVSSNFSFANLNNMAVIFSMALAWNFAYVLLSPVFVSVLFIGFQHCWKPRPRSSTTTHSDIFTFNMAAFEMLAVLGSCINIVFFLTLRFHLLQVGDNLCYMTTLGQALFHYLVSSERYLAVVHPIVYLRLKKKGVVVRNASIAAVWLFTFIMAVVYSYRFPRWNTLCELIIGFFSLFFVAFFCISVLYVLVRPGPGDRAGNRKHVDQSKHRAFYTIAAITLAMMLKFFMMFASRVVFLSDTGLVPSFRDYLLSMIVQWFYFPSSLVMPVLFLYQQVKRSKRPK